MKSLPNLEYPGVWIVLCRFPDQVSNRAETTAAQSLKDVRRHPKDPEGSILLHGLYVGKEWSAEGKPGQWHCDSLPRAGSQLENSQEIRFSHFSGHRQEVGEKPGKSQQYRGNCRVSWPICLQHQQSHVENGHPARVCLQRGWICPSCAPQMNWKIHLPLPKPRASFRAQQLASPHTDRGGIFYSHFPLKQMLLLCLQWNKGHEGLQWKLKMYNIVEEWANKEWWLTPVFQTGGAEFPERVNEVACCYWKFLHQPTWVHCRGLPIYKENADLWWWCRMMFFLLGRAVPVSWSWWNSALLHTFCGLCLPGQSLTSVPFWKMNQPPYSCMYCTQLPAAFSLLQ